MHGLVTTKRGALETKDGLRCRIDEASKYVPLDQLCPSPQCGFSSTVEAKVLTYDDEMARLRLIVETAEDVWADVAAVTISRSSSCESAAALAGTAVRGTLSGSPADPGQERSSAAQQVRQ